MCGARALITSFVILSVAGATVMLGSGRDKRRLKDNEATKDPSRASSRDTDAGDFLSSS